MAGIYIHIPFCKQACHYCDFHFSTTLNLKGELVSAICKELQLRKGEISSVISTIYLGGGTPSLLSTEELNSIFQTIKSNYNVEEDAEITLEANPDDLTAEKLAALRATDINRLSIGIQSFRDEDLQFMNRAHKAAEAIQCVKSAAAAGFANITVDLIYGIPGMDGNAWEQNVKTALSLPVNHLSAYCLTIEEGTALAYKIKKGLSADVDDEVAAKHFESLQKLTEAAGMPWYEISNFAKPGFESKHNSSYWKGEQYVGIGPSAHSFHGTTRSWNVRNNIQYIQSIAEGKLPSESETLSYSQQVNEKILTGLRTRKGLTLQDIRNIDPSAPEKILANASLHLTSGKLQLKEDTLTLTRDGLLFADAIAADLFL